MKLTKRQVEILKLLNAEHMSYLTIDSHYSFYWFMFSSGNNKNFSISKKTFDVLSRNEYIIKIGSIRSKSNKLDFDVMHCISNKGKQYLKDLEKGKNYD